VDTRKGTVLAEKKTVLAEKKTVEVAGSREGDSRVLRPWEPVALARLGGFGDALVGGSKTGGTDTGAMGMS
jgi:hypothetical protein